MASIVEQDPDSKTDAHDSVSRCEEQGPIIGVPPATTEIRCQLAVGHDTQHYGHVGGWTATWGRGSQFAPWVNH